MKLLNENQQATIAGWVEQVNQKDGEPIVVFEAPYHPYVWNGMEVKFGFNTIPHGECPRQGHSREWYCSTRIFEEDGEGNYRDIDGNYVSEIVPEGHRSQKVEEAISQYVEVS